MKKIFPILLLILTLVSCSEDVKFNNEAVFQGVLNNNSWVGANASAERTSGKITIQATTLNEVMRLQIPVPPVNTINPKNPNTFAKYVLGTNNTNTAYYSVSAAGETFEYQTAIGVGDGEILVKEYDGTTISGTFRFNAKSTDPESDELVNLQSGTFYKVPVYNKP